MSEGAPALAARIVARVPATEDDAARGARASPRPRRGRLAARSPGDPPRRPRWLLVGDAAGFLDPFTGEGLHRALVSTELAAAAIEA